MFVTVAITERWTKFQNIKVGQCDLDYDFLAYFCTAYFPLLTVYLRELCSFSRSIDIHRNP